MTEVWKPIEETNGDYLVSNLGKVKNNKTGKTLAPRPTKTGYLRVRLPVDNGRKDIYIHRIVANAFCERPEGCDIINHLDNNNQNNAADNLEWTTQFGNVHYGMRQKRYKLNAVRVVGIKNGEQVEFPSAHFAGLMTGCDHSTIIKCCKGKKKTAHGYQWKYAEVV